LVPQTPEVCDAAECSSQRVDHGRLLPRSQSRSCPRNPLPRRRRSPAFPPTAGTLPGPLRLPLVPLLLDGQPLPSAAATSPGPHPLAAVGWTAGRVLALLSATLPTGRPSVPGTVQDASGRDRPLPAQLWPVHRTQSVGGRIGRCPVGLSLVE